MALNSYYKNSEPTSSEFGLIVRLVTPTTPVPVTPVPSSSSPTRTDITAANADTAVLSAGTRVGVTMFNDSGVAVNILFDPAAAASATNFSVQIGAYGYYEVPNAFVSARMRAFWISTPAAADRLRVTSV